jgi:hypothetical protein
MRVNIRTLIFFIVITFYTPKAGALQKAEWMTELYAFRPSTRLIDVVIPGTHQSGSYNISYFSDVEPGDNVFYGLIRPMVASWAKAQFRSVREQLIGGVRFLDLRVAFDRQGQAILTHGLVSLSLREVLSEISGFLMEHPQEVILIATDLSYGYHQSLPSPEEVHTKASEMKQIFFDYFGEKIIPFSQQRSFSDFWNRGASVMLMEDYQDFWADSYQLGPLKSYLEESLRRQKLSKFRNLQMIFTPPEKISFFLNPKYGFPIFGEENSLTALTKELHDHTIAWIREWHAQGLRLNIVTSDFFDRIPFVDFLLELNQTH